ncbi:S8 family peptidase [Streptomyces sp. NPDC056501]|uniref:S8 family peptidase n=1 Tax=Streptomyces sp. NPDC056501 TaxID=3345841 RepID=UPI0036D01E23
MDTAELFVAGRRESFAGLSQRMQRAGSFPENSPLRILEGFRAPSSADKQRGIADEGSSGASLYEVGLHLPASDRDAILRSFVHYASSCGAEADVNRSFPVSGLIFMPVLVSHEELEDLSKFSFLRVVRPMPKLRTMHPVERSLSIGDLPPSPLPSEPPVDPSIRMAIFDGGLPDHGPMSAWAKSFHSPDVGPAVAELVEHGHMVTSAALFGSLKPGEDAPRPFSSVDHYRILDGEGEDSLDLYTTLARIRDVLEEKRYDFVNLSLGPELPIEDDEVHPWTAVLDEYLSAGQTFLTVAAGNNGLYDWESGNARVQVPSDCVNALAVGSADSRRINWGRAEYSAIGPGRSPGMVKPDLLGFGGAQYEHFHFVPHGLSGGPLSAMGTSFAAPSVLRMAAGVRAHLGGHIKPLALKALLVHCADRGDVPLEEAGWGRVPDSVEDFIVCSPNSVRVLYQGSIEPGQTVRMPIPLPEDVTDGMVTISATYCINSPVDSRTPSTYTGSAIEPFFRPHAERMANDDSVHAATKPFFQGNDYASETELRQGSHKWETVKHKSKKFRAATLLRPVFDVRHLSRVEQMAGVAAEKTDYALVVTLTTSKDTDIYNKVIRAFSGRLEVMQPQVEIPISVRP